MAGEMHQLRLVVYPTIYRVLAPSQVTLQLLLMATRNLAKHQLRLVGPKKFISVITHREATLMGWGLSFGPTYPI